MSSIIEGYNYDIFISYRQKDNKGERWVSEFVEALKTELESTFKEEISVYFDINPHDGLLETHDVDASLQEKLKCLIFIPIISRTYCDPASFAWEHEFKAFIEQASPDKSGLKVKLPNGNVANRVLPVRIHDLNADDTKLCEEILGGVIRGVDFIYKSPGVNRPLMANEEHPKDNLNKTYYRDQINKVANAIDEILQSIKYGKSSLTEKPSRIQKGRVPEESKSNSILIRKLSSRVSNKGLIIFLTVFLTFIAVFGIYKFIIPTYIKKTIAVIPFTNPVNDYTLASFSVGSMDAIITKLQEVNSLTVRSRISSLQYLDTKKPLSKIRNELKINYLIDISIEGTKDNMKMWVGLTKTKGNKQLWAKQYNIDEKQLMPLFTEIVQVIAGKLNVVFSPEEVLNVKQNLTQNPDAYVNYLNGTARLFTAMENKFVDSVSFISAIQMFDKAIEYDPDFAIAYAKRALARSWGIYTGQLSSAHNEKCWSDIITAERIKKELPDVQIAYGFYYYYCKKDYLNALINFHTASIMDKENYQSLFYMALVYRQMGDWEKSQILINRVIDFNPQEALYLTNIGLSYCYIHDFDSALIYHQKAIDNNPEWSDPYINKLETLILKYGNTSEAHAVLDTAIRKTHKKLNEYEIILDIYDGKYTDALNKTKKSDFADFTIKGSRYLYFANIYNLLNKPEVGEKYYDSAMVILNLELSKDSTNSLIHSYLGIANAGKGNENKAIIEGKKAIELSVVNKNKMIESYMILFLTKIYIMLGSYDLAKNNAEVLLKNPSCFSIKLMQIDPCFKLLLTHPEFKTIIKEYSKKKILNRQV